MFRYPCHAGSPWVAEAVSRVLALELHGTAIHPLPIPPDPSVQRLILEAIAQHRVVEVLSPHLGALGVDSETAQVVYHWRRQLGTAGLRLLVDTNTVSTLLHSAGIDHLVVKGVALSSMLGLDPTRRGAGDIDIWVRPTDVACAEEILHGAGWSRFDRTLPRPTDGWRWWVLLRATNELTQRADGSSPVDLHWRLTPFVGEQSPDFDDAYQRSIAIAEVAEHARTLSAPDALRHLAQQGRKDAFATLRQVVDIVRLAERCDSSTLVTMSAEDRNVALAVAVANELVAPLVPEQNIHRRSRELAHEGWRRCLSLQTPFYLLDGIPHREALLHRTRYETWMFRTAPTCRARVSGLTQLAIPRRWLMFGRKNHSYPSATSDCDSRRR